MREESEDSETRQKENDLSLHHFVSVKSAVQKAILNSEILYRRKFSTSNVSAKT